MRFLLSLKRFSRLLSRRGAPANDAIAAAKTAGAAVTASLPDMRRGGRSSRRAADGRKSLFFRRFQRPQVSDRFLNDFTLNDARIFSTQAREFYARQVDLMRRSAPEETDSMFYEELEKQDILNILGRDKDGVDKNYIEQVDLFRRISNENTRRLFITISLTALLMVMLVSFGISTLSHAYLGPNSPIEFALLVLPVISSLVSIAFVYHISYLNQMEKNIQALDTWVSTKFGRIKSLLLKAEQQAQKIESDKSYTQAENVREESGVWTLTYQWLGLRLYFCELLLRNVVFQVRRNTRLYVLGGCFLAIVIAAGVVAGLAALAGAMSWGGGAVPVATRLGVVAVIFIIAVYSVVIRDPFAIVADVLREDQWSRFHTMGLADIIASRVGYDKTQILTFRDRMRPGGL